MYCLVKPQPACAASSWVHLLPAGDAVLYAPRVCNLVLFSFMVLVSKKDNVLVSMKYNVLVAVNWFHGEESDQNTLPTQLLS